MLKTISPLLTPDALHALASMGHGDDLVIVDANFPAAQVARQSGARLVQIPGADAPAVLAALLPLFPLDTFVPQCAWSMQIVGDARAVPPPVAEFRKLLHAAGEREPATLERFAFYEQAQRAFLILRSGELRKYGNLILRKGVVSTD